jgi:DNA/RNA endonuclease G (NUC1)
MLVIQLFTTTKKEIRMSDTNNIAKAEAYKVTATTRDGNPVEAYVLPEALHSYRRTMMEEYGNFQTVEVTLEEMEEKTGVVGLAAEVRAAK